MELFKHSALGASHSKNAMRLLACTQHFPAQNALFSRAEKVEDAGSVITTSIQPYPD